MPGSPKSRPQRRRLERAAVASATAVLAVGLVAAGLSPASAATTIDGPVGLGTAASFSVLGATAVTNTGPSVLDGDLGLSPGTSITGFPPGTVLGTTHADTTAAQAQADTSTAYDVAASLSPTSSGLTDLVGMTLTPGVYSGGALTLSGTLTLAGSADSVWVFQAASSLITSSSSSIVLTGGASSCNVFWQVGSSATLGTASTMVGTVMALTSISTGTGTNVQGRLLARTGAVTLDSTTFVQPAGCAAAGVVTSSPTITSGAPTAATLGTPYEFQVTSTGTGTISYTGGGLPPGLTMDSATGTISGTPTSAGTFAVTITADNGAPPPASVTYQFAVRALLAETGTTSTTAAPLALGAVLAGIVLLLVPHHRRRGSPRH